MIVAIIPAKGTSEGLPGKNNKIFMGKSLIARAIESANLPAIDQIYVSTDSTEIVAESLNQNIKKLDILPRPTGLTLPGVEVDEVILFSLRQIEAVMGERSVDTVIVLQPTSPLRHSAHVSEALDQYLSYAKKAGIPLLSGYYSSKFHYMDSVADPSTVVPVDNDPLTRIGRQYYREGLLFVENGAIYIASGPYIKRFKTFRGKTMEPYEMEELASIEIDDDVDWALAQTCYTRKEYYGDNR